MTVQQHSLVLPSGDEPDLIVERISRNLFLSDLVAGNQKYISIMYVVGTLIGVPGPRW